MTINLGLPKGRMASGVDALLADAGIVVRSSDRAYRATLSIEGFNAKLLKPQNIVGLLDSGALDLGFAGADWIAEQKSDAVLLVDTGLDPVRIVVAGPEGAALPPPSARGVRIASEFEYLTTRWLADNNIDGIFVRSYGATEVFPPDDADLIIDVAASGATLRANQLVVLDDVMESRTGLYASPTALADPTKRKQIDDFVLLIESVLRARRQVMITMNVDADRLEALLGVLPSMSAPTVSSLAGRAGYAVNTVVARSALITLVPEITRIGGRDLIATELFLVVP